MQNVFNGGNDDVIDVCDLDVLDEDVEWITIESKRDWIQDWWQYISDYSDGNIDYEDVMRYE